jgi:hypothetical protein|tara:strand:- start:10034 stop:10864 length:831 start_codon:yes stop_codon:yes gene_type:complete
MTTYKDLENRERVQADDGKTYYKQHTVTSKKKGIKGLLQRLIPGGDSGISTRPDLPFGERSTADFTDKHNRKLADKKERYIVGGDASDDKTQAVARKTRGALDDGSSDVGDIVALIARQKEKAKLQAQEVNDGSGKWDDVAPNDVMGKDSQMEGEMNRQRVKDVRDSSNAANSNPYGEGASSERRRKAINLDNLNSLKESDGLGIPEGDYDKLKEYISSQEDHPEGMSIADYYQSMLEGKDVNLYTNLNNKLKNDKINSDVRRRAMRKQVQRRKYD